MTAMGWRQMEAAERKEWEVDAQPGFCQSCGMATLIQLAPDPFVVEGISDGDPKEESAWCYSCLNTRRDDV